MGLNFSSSVNGINSALTKNNVRTNNIANVNSRGYKSRRAEQTDSSTGGPAVKSVVVDVSQGALEQTNIPTDLAIQGKGFFQVENSSGDKQYTRNLSLQIKPDGQITDQHSNIIPGMPKNLESNKAIHVEQDGTVIVRDENGETTEVGKLMVMDFKNPQGLVSTGDGYYQTTPAAGTPIANNTQVKILQGMQEKSNVDLAGQITGQIADEAAVKANVKAIKAQDEMLGDVIDLQG